MGFISLKPSADHISLGTPMAPPPPPTQLGNSQDGSVSPAGATQRVNGYRPFTDQDKQGFADTLVEQFDVKMGVDEFDEMVDLTSDFPPQMRLDMLKKIHRKVVSESPPLKDVGPGWGRIEHWVTLIRAKASAISSVARVAESGPTTVRMPTKIHWPLVAGAAAGVAVLMSMLSKKKRR